MRTMNILIMTIMMAIRLSSKERTKTMRTTQQKEGIRLKSRFPSK
jgi:hypothetical protein